MKKNGRRNKKRFSVPKLILGTIFFMIVWLGFMWGLDAGLSVLAKLPHRISGEVWFQMISSCLLAAPSMGISVYAVYQTKYSQDLEKERLRPGMLMKEAMLSMYMIYWEGFETQCVKNRDMEKFCQQYKQKHEKCKEMGLLVLKSTVILKSGDSLEWVSFQEMNVTIGKRHYTMKFDERTTRIEKGNNKENIFNWNYNNGYEKYVLSWKLDFCDIKSGSGTTEEFWQDMYNAVVEENYGINRRGILLEIPLNIGYGQGRRDTRKGTSVLWKIKWENYGKSKVENYAGTRKSRQGIFKYD